MAMQQNSGVMIIDTALPFWFDTIRIKSLHKDILMRHCIIIIIIIVLLLLFYVRVIMHRDESL
jgi:hypothetical protein